MKIIKKEFNVQTGEETITEREETAAETKARLDNAKEIAAKEAEIAAKETARQAVLTKLGLTVEEMAALLS